MSATMDGTAQVGGGPAAYQAFLVPAMFAPFAERLVDAAGIAPGARVLDLACGTGAATRAAAARAVAGGRVTGVDLGAPMLAVARKQPSPDGAAPIEYREGDAGAPPGPRGAFDVALCQQGLQFFPDPRAALDATRAALVPNGRLAVSVWAGVETAIGFAALVSALRRHLDAEAAALMRSPFAFGHASALAWLLVDAGFADVRVAPETLSVTFAAAPRDWAGLALDAGPLAARFAAASAAQRDAVGADVATVLEDCVDGDGAVRFPMTAFLGLARA